MYIKQLVIENFQCYYSRKEFKFSKGLNIILGANGHGKSKLFDAIQWLFTGEIDEDKMSFIRESIISKKALNEMTLDDIVTVRVALEVQQESIPYTIERQYTVTLRSENDYIIKEEFSGYELLANGERQVYHGAQILERVFPSKLRRYCLFKGERSLNIFDPNRNPDALNNLINSLSEFKSYDRYIKITEGLYEASKTSVERLASRYSSSTRKFEIKIAERDHLKKNLLDKEHEIKDLNRNLNVVKEHMDDSVGVLEKGEAIKAMNSNIVKLDKEISNIRYLIDSKMEYTHFLFDDHWILNQFQSIREDFSKKIKKASRERRQLNDEFLKELGKKEAIQEITKTTVPLPIGTPSEEHMEEMLQEEICKVCNREAKQGSDEYNYMKQRLEDYLLSISKPSAEIAEGDEEQEQAFKNTFIEEFRDINKRLERQAPKLLSLKKSIQENFEFVETRKSQLEDLEVRLSDKEKEKERLLSQYSTGERDLLQTAADIRRFSSDRTRYERELSKAEYDAIELRAALAEKETEINKINTEGVPSALIEKRDVLFDIYKIAKDTKERKYNDFINDLKESANHYYHKLGKASDGYTGMVDLYRLRNDMVVVRAIDERSKEDVTGSLNSSTITSLYLAILMAISDLAKNKLSERLPMIFDAPISDFDHSKSLEFFTIAKNTFEQSIVMMKNYVEKDMESNIFYINENFSEIEPDNAYWIKLDEGINHKELHTVNSKIERIR
ncbi:AAA family ATPase [Sunxiuqinia sp. sy24]|uniref:AAA family ATPase n=1 Tax=Sunxiuqinia sp. sy24 TaxID=3461495 RepID=UPI00404543D4